MTVGTILLLIIVLLMVGVLPAWPYSNRWGYMPVSITGLLLVIVITLLVMGRI